MLPARREDINPYFKAALNVLREITEGKATLILPLVPFNVCSF